VPTARRGEVANVSSVQPLLSVSAGKTGTTHSRDHDLATNQAYQVPKRRVLAQVVLSGHPPRDIWLYLSDCGDSQWGRERPSDLLNGGNGFIPATDPGGGVVLLQRDAVVLLVVPAEQEVGAGYPQELEQAGLITTHSLELLLNDGTSLIGSATYSRPDGGRRLQDFLNSSDNLFFPVRVGDVVLLVNRHCIVSVSPTVGAINYPRRRAEDGAGKVS
jgi:hypothetical protein